MNSFGFRFAFWFALASAFAIERSQAVTIDTVPVGNPGNAPDTTGFGSVNYSYRIAKYEVTNADYVEFLNAVDPAGVNSLHLYESLMATTPMGGIVYDSLAGDGLKYRVRTGRGNNPVVYISWYDAIRFTNWLHNGQGNGETETGAYTLLGETPAPSNGSTIIRNAGARWFLPSEDEWYKAAYHKNDGVTGNYWDYPTSSDDVPDSDEPPGIESPTPANTANFGNRVIVSIQNPLTDVGAYTFSENPYGTFDQAGNAFEWVETLTEGSWRVERGGSAITIAGFLAASGRLSADPSVERYFTTGFRVATIVPEPNATLLSALACLCLLARRRRGIR